MRRRGECSLSPPGRSRDSDNYQRSRPSVDVRMRREPCPITLTPTTVLNDGLREESISTETDSENPSLTAHHIKQDAKRL